MSNQFSFALFKAWTSLGQRLRADLEKRSATVGLPYWPQEAMDMLLTAMQAVDSGETAILERSRQLLSPFGEPLELDFGLNRWLRGQREEAYSDWLEWFFSRLRTHELSETLNIPPTHIVGKIIAAQPDELVKVRREVVVEKGHEEASGRLDLVLEITDSALVVIEVKRGSAQSSDTRKQSGYIASLRERTIPFSPILMVTDSTEEEIDGFRVLRYDDFCLALRCFVLSRINDERGYIFTSFVLALAATIESNLLNLGVFGGRPTFAAISYLNRFLEINK